MRVARAQRLTRRARLYAKIKAGRLAFTSLSLPLSHSRLMYASTRLPIIAKGSMDLYVLYQATFRARARAKLNSMSATTSVTSDDSGGKLEAPP